MIPQWIREHNEQADSYGGIAGLAGLSGALKNVYSQFRKVAFPKLTPLLSQVRKSRSPQRYGGKALFFDVVLSKHAPPGHLYVLPNQGTIVVPNQTIKAGLVSLPVIQNPHRGMITGVTIL